MIAGDDEDPHAAHLVCWGAPQGQAHFCLRVQRQQDTDHVLPSVSLQELGQSPSGSTPLPHTSVSIHFLTPLPHSAQAAAIADASQKAFAIAHALRTDPFAIKRKGAATPEAMTPLFSKHEISRERLTAKSILGHGQVCGVREGFFIV